LQFLEYGAIKVSEIATLFCCQFICGENPRGGFGTILTEAQNQRNVLTFEDIATAS
jgi:hypothetical protein